MIWLALIIIYVGITALTGILASSRPPGITSTPEIILFIMAQAILAFMLIRLLVWMF